MRVLAVGCAAALAGFGGAAAAPAPRFFDAIGVNTHVYALNTAYGDLQAVMGALEYLGVRHVRDNPPLDASPKRYLALEQAGIGLDLVARSDAEPALSLYEVLAQQLDVVEGPNEVNAHPASLLYHGLVDFPAAFQLQSSLFDEVRADRKLRGVPVAMFSAVDHGAADWPPYPGMGGKADVSNVHAYPPAAAVPPEDYLPRDIALWSAAVPGAPVLVTELGYFTWQNAPRGAGVNEDVQAQWTLDALADNFFTPDIERQYIYELVDQNPDDAAPNKENHFGLFENSWQPKPVAIAIHNLYEILGCTAARAGADAAVRISGLPATAHEGFLAAGGAKFVLLWNEMHPAPLSTVATPIAVTVDVSGASSLGVYDPLRGTPPLQQTSAGKLTISLADDLLVIKINA